MTLLKNIVLKRCNFCRRFYFVLASTFHIFAILGVMAIFTFLFIEPEPPVIFHGARAITPVVKPGELLHVQYNITKTKYCPGTVTRSIQSCGVWPSQTVPVSVEPGPKKWVDVYFRVPSNIIKGSTCTYQSHIIYECTIFKRIHVTAPIIPFKIENGHES